MRGACRSFDFSSASSGDVRAHAARCPSFDHGTGPPNRATIVWKAWPYCPTPPTSGEAGIETMEPAKVGPLREAEQIAAEVFNLRTASGVPGPKAVRQLDQPDEPGAEPKEDGHHPARKGPSPPHKADHGQNQPWDREQRHSLTLS